MLFALLGSLWVGPLVALLIAVIGQVRRQGDAYSSRVACRWWQVSR